MDLVASLRHIPSILENIFLNCGLSLADLESCAHVSRLWARIQFEGKFSQERMRRGWSGQMGSIRVYDFDGLYDPEDDQTFVPRCHNIVNVQKRRKRATGGKSKEVERMLQVRVNFRVQGEVPFQDDSLHQVFVQRDFLGLICSNAQGLRRLRVYLRKTLEIIAESPFRAEWQGKWECTVMDEGILAILSCPADSSHFEQSHSIYKFHLGMSDKRVEGSCLPKVYWPLNTQSSFRKANDKYLCFRGSGDMKHQVEIYNHQKRELYWVITNPNITFLRNMGKEYFTVWMKPGLKIHLFDLETKRELGALVGETNTDRKRQDRYESEGNDDYCWYYEQFQHTSTGTRRNMYIWNRDTKETKVIQLDFKTKCEYVHTVWCNPWEPLILVENISSNYSHQIMVDLKKANQVTLTPLRLARGEISFYFSALSFAYEIEGRHLLLSFEEEESNGLKLIGS